MVKKAKWFGVVLVLAVVTASGMTLFKKTNNTSEHAQKKAIQEAMIYKSPKSSICTSATTPAIHKKTGAEYTFSSGCLAPGWEAK